MGKFVLYMKLRKVTPYAMTLRDTLRSLRATLREQHFMRSCAQGLRAAYACLRDACANELVF